MGKVFSKYTPSLHVLQGSRYPEMDAIYVDEIFHANLTIVDQMFDSDIVTLSCRATYDSEAVGFDLSLPRICYAGLSDNSPQNKLRSGALMRPGAVFTHSGIESETFTKALAGGLGLPVAASRYDRLHDDIALSVIHLSPRDIDLTQSQAAFQLLNETAPTARLYWEARLNIDIPGRTVRLGEQCTNYRAAMAATFCQSWGPKQATCMQHLA